MQRQIITTLSLAILFASCVQEQEPEQETGSLFLTAYTDDTITNQTKTHLQDERYVLWDATDAITVLGSAGAYHSTSITITDAGRVATFRMPSGTSGSLAIYPKDEDATYSDETVTTTLPAIQTAVEGSFAQGVNLAIAEVTDLSKPLYYRNAGALLSLKVGLANITKIVLEPLEDGKRLAGPCSVSFDSKGQVVCTATGTGSQSVTLEGTFTKGSTYSFVVLPGTYNGLKVTMTNTSGQAVAYKNTQSITVKSNDNYYIAELKDPEQVAGIDIDFSYAGYNHGESAPEDRSIAQLADDGYTIYNVTEHGLNGTDEVSDRAAFIEMLKKFSNYQTTGDGDLRFTKTGSGKVVIYFPNGHYILQASGDETAQKTIFIEGSDIILKGESRDGTIIEMASENTPRTDGQLYSGPVMLSFKNQSGLGDAVNVSADAEKGSKSIQVESVTGFSEGSWVCLKLNTTNENAVSEELGGQTAESSWTDITTVKVVEYHQIASISGNTVTFVEPIMHEVKSTYGWTLHTYSHYSEVGIEDITFKGNAPSGYVHHTENYDGAYKIVNMQRIVNGWMRRVKFTSVSEASSIVDCAQVSVYDVEIDGERGHSSIRSQSSSRVFLGKIRETSGEGQGQDHAVGVSKPAIGTVLWRNTWGSNSCFEAHASQPRATLIDCCKGGWNQMHQGGAANELPNHLADLIIWNFEATSVDTSTWDWWTLSGHSWKFLPVTVVGFHGASCTFTSGKCDISNGAAVFPESLYEQQLQARLGTIPAWLLALK
ncbi:MAG: DUF4955 domain-containing protein [Candidatus Cryptobacteroides sp.]